MSQITKIKNILSRREAWFAIFVLVFLSVLAFSVGQRTGKQKVISQANTVYLHMEEKFTQQEVEKKALQQQVATLNQHRLLQEETLLNLREYVEGLQGENAALANNADIYQSLIQEGRKANNLTVRKFKLYSTPRTDRMRYSLILSKMGISNDVISGDVNMSIHGKIGSKLITLPIKHFNLPEHQGLRYQFKHFQELSGELDIPDNFSPTHISVRVHNDGQSKPAIEQWFNWTEVAMPELG